MTIDLENELLLLDGYIGLLHHLVTSSNDNNIEAGDLYALADGFQTVRTKIAERLKAYEEGATS